MDGQPGIHTARYAGPLKDPDSNMNLVLKNLKQKSDRSAQFRAVIAMIAADKEYLFEGICKGKISELKKGNGGFGYDPIFIPDGYSKTFAEMGDEIKSVISHRARAIKKLLKFLENIN